MGDLGLKGRGAEALAMEGGGARASSASACWASFVLKKWSMDPAYICE